MKNIKKFILIFTLIIFGFLCFGTVNSKAADRDPGPLTKTGASKINPNDTSVVVHNADEFIDACIKSTYVYDNRNNDAGVSTVSENFYANSDTRDSNKNGGTSNITNIKLANDIDLTTSSYGRYYMHRSRYGGPDGNKINGQSGDIWDWANTMVRHNGAVTIDGNGKTIDYGYNNMALQQNDGANWTFKDIKIYGQSFYGPLSINDPNCTVTYDNVSYYGPQLIHSQGGNGCKINVIGDVDVHSVPWYKSFDGTKYKADSNSGPQDEQNMQVGDVEFHKNSHYYGETYGGNVLELTGNLNADEGAKIELHPHKFGSTEDSYGSNSSGIVFLGNSQLDAYDNAQIKIICNTDPIKTNSGEKIGNPDSSSKWISTAVYGASSSQVNMHENSTLESQGAGMVAHSSEGGASDALMQLGKLKLTVDKGASFINNFNKDKDYSGYTNDGVVSISGGQININSGGTFNIDSNMHDVNNDYNYILYTSGATTINLLNPKSVYWNDQNQVDMINSSNSSNYNRSLSNSTLIHIGDYSFINATDASLETIGQGKNGQNTSITPPVPISRFLLPFSGSWWSQDIDTNYMRISGDYFDSKKVADSVNDAGGNQYAMMHFTQLTIPKITVSSGISNDNNKYIHGNVKDENGNNLKNAYVKIYIRKDDTKDDSQDSDNRTYYYDSDNTGKDKNDLAKTIIKSNKILYNKYKKDFPTSTSYLSGSTFNSKQLIKTDDFQNDNFFDTNIFSSLLNDDFNKYSTVIQKPRPYMALTDENGNFHFNVPEKTWEDVGDAKKDLSVYATYNFIDSDKFNIKLNEPLQLDVENKMKDLTNDNESNSDNKLNEVNQGDTDEDGDTLEFDSTLRNTSRHIDFKELSYEQPVPLSANLDTLEIKDGDGFKKLDPNDCTVETEDNYKIIKLNNISLPRTNAKPGESNPGTTKQIDLKVTLKNPITDKQMDFNSQLETRYDDVVKGPDMSINFKGLSRVKVDPQDLYYGANSQNATNLFLSTNQHLGATVDDQRKEKTPIGLYVHQNNDTFSKNGDGLGDSFKGELFYIDGSNMTSLLDHNVEVEQSNADNELTDLYWNRNKQIKLKLDNNYNFHGDYQNGDNDKNNPGLTWTIQNGPGE
ncbi:hypothetical protein GSH19_05500 [Lactobacillus sp. S2-2]|uniref:pectate lyase-like adhesive domain-containing protein n=1 Tax=Lactobacillus sp. S2-2 TaxID=2692917 RepID=UPI001F15A5D1|nr:pectate lyase-like adhesive domain-containing protein [Lactobacillus sp. S2-2]MCF6515607.1 hypothetical protein [Lactobacillus sp. S2-2]